MKGFLPPITSILCPTMSAALGQAPSALLLGTASPALLEVTASVPVLGPGQAAALTPPPHLRWC